MAIEAEFCLFTTARLEVEMQPLSLSGGIANVELNITQALPDGTSVLFQVQNNGQWVTMGPGSPLLGLPALTRFKVVFLGTQDVMPQIGLGSQSEITTWRPANNYKHICLPRTCPSTTTVQVQQRLEAWDPLHHTAVARLLYGAGFGTVLNYSSVKETVPIEDPNARVRIYYFTFPAAQTTYQIQQEGTTDAVLITHHVAGRTDVSF